MEENVNDRPVRFELVGALGIVTLDRPHALNALTHDMVRSISRQLDAWEDDPAVERVLFEGEGERGFCAGGDVVAIREDALAGGTGTLDFWRDEYTLDARIARYPKPVIAIMHGLVLGGGVGLSGHARHRIVTETSKVGMPETTIGFVPDVGGTWLLSRAPGELGTLLALTARSVDGADAIHLGLADVLVPHDRIGRLRAALAHTPAEAAIAAFAGDPGHPSLADDRPWIDDCLAHDDVSEIVGALRAAGRLGVAEAILAKSPTTLTLALASLRRARALPSLEAALVQEFRVSTRCFGIADLVEGIRAQLVDKDREPRWNPPTLAEVDRAALERFFDPLPDDLRLPTANQPAADQPTADQGAP